jgi:tRNA threonylcarbamoyladenosine biosynthesis protein TsaB
MATILSLETSTNVCSVALHDDGKLIASSEVHIEQSHASKLALLIDDLKRLSDFPLNKLAGVAISSGPGSYTGLRIGTSTAKGLCYALNIPLIAVGTLDLLASQVNKYNLTENLLIPTIDARRMEVYCQLTNAKLYNITPVEAKIIDESSFIDLLENNQITFFGNGADKCQEVIKHKNAFFLKNIYPSAIQLGSIAFEKFSEQKFENLSSFEPFYLKDFIAKKPAVLI